LERQGRNIPSNKEKEEGGDSSDDSYVESLKKQQKIRKKKRKNRRESFSGKRDHSIVKERKDVKFQSRNAR